MNLYDDNDGKFPDDADVQVRYPLTDRQSAAGRMVWPWVDGYVVGQCGPNEWDICVDGADPIDHDEHGEPLYPLVFRDASELRLTGPHAAVARIAEELAEQEDAA
ncbi:hypothetical protein Aca07nite_27880 [Actinoplanes capillaceus]|uniref:Immunity protein 53 n=1 Tax=Actinoplanes campanulatus TaxID=113559 RepID=A0ABQ3WH01_9ACTN|nr:hypothetical protein [Actinoplanes capillaceus]GID45513.1 hypothetical protein Aca07nite_27880 [Actinoplanes capillaceus]